MIFRVEIIKNYILITVTKLNIVTPETIYLYFSYYK